MSGKIVSKRMLIGGGWVAAVDLDEIEVRNPATRESVGTVPRGRDADCDAAVAAARAAFPAWRDRVPRERGRLLHAVGEAIEERIDELATTLATETGNAIRTQSRPEVGMSADLFRYFAGLASETKGETVPLGPDLLSYTVREPVGVVGAIVPWNSPLVIASVKIAMSLMIGNTVVLKAPEDAPLTILDLAEICDGLLPAGVVNVVTGLGPEIGAALAKHSGVDKVTFTGSTEVGRSVMAAAADRVGSVSLELGGKSPAIVFPDSDDDLTVSGVIAGMRFARQGQSCTAGSRLLVHESIFDSFTQRLVGQLDGMRVGDPLDESTDIGALINAKQFEKVSGYIADGLKSGRALTGGMPPKSGALAGGYFHVPTVIADVQPEWRIAREEIFGPVLVAMPWRTEEQAIAMANDTHYGLSAFVWSKDMSTALRVAHGIEAGWVQVNRGGGILPGMSFGGVKQSGLGREYSLEGALDDFSHRKSITVGINIPNVG